MNDLARLRKQIRRHTLMPEIELAPRLVAAIGLDATARRATSQRALDLVKRLRAKKTTGLMETFLAEYGLSSEEGVALMRLTEALLRVPDADTQEELIEDKLVAGRWEKHLGRSRSQLVNASTLALMVTRKVLDNRYPGTSRTLGAAIKRLGEPVIRTAVEQALKLMGHQFVLGRNIDEAIKRAAVRETKGFVYSYDMLGEAAVTSADATRYFNQYRDAILAIAKSATGADVRSNPGISVKLSALHPRYETLKRNQVLDELVPRVLELAVHARRSGLGMNIDAEEADRLDLSLDIIEAVLSDPELAGWDGFGVVVQAYGRRALPVLDWLHALAAKHDRRIMVRLVKGAYWDTEIKIAQTLGITSYPVFTRKPLTDVSYIAAAARLLKMSDRLYPQFATHNAHTISAILEMAEPQIAFEFQRLHGMGEAVHDLVHADHKHPCRIYAPVGAHRDLLAYLVRRLLENGANSSFVNQIVDDTVSPEVIVADPIAEVERLIDLAASKAPDNPLIPAPPALYGPRRANAMGWNIQDPGEVEAILEARGPFESKNWHAEPLLVHPHHGHPAQPVQNPALPPDQPGTVVEATAQDAQTAILAARAWKVPSLKRSATLKRAADLYEKHAAELFALAAREAGKTLLDAVAEVREAVDFLRYYANEAEALEAPALGTFSCISPWNFPLAIFTGQIAAALATGNAVVAKPAETTPLIAFRAVQLLHEAGVPRESLQFLPGRGSEVGEVLSSAEGVNGVVFTGSLATATRINRAMAANLSPHAPLIAETGGINAMIVDSTALPEQAIKDVLASAFQSAGQRCSALRVLYVQDEIADTFVPMLKGAMDTLDLGDPLDPKTDIGPVIDEAAAQKINAHIANAKRQNRLVHQISAPQAGTFVPPTLIAVEGIGDVREEIFGPVLHIARFTPKNLKKVIADIAASGFGLTFGLHTRVDRRIAEISAMVPAGNIYVNRNQIGAIVGSQPFGGEGLSGTGPKAGGPHYLTRFVAHSAPCAEADPAQPGAKEMDLATVQASLDRVGHPVDPGPRTQISLPGVTGETNELKTFPRGLVLCLGPGLDLARAQAEEAQGAGCTCLTVCPGGDLDGEIAPQFLSQLVGFAAIVFWGNEERATALRVALAERQGEILPLITTRNDATRYIVERHTCINTTASGGNTQLLAAAGRSVGE